MRTGCDKSAFPVGCTSDEEALRLRAAEHAEDFDGFILLAACSTKDLSGTAIKKRAKLPADTVEAFEDYAAHEPLKPAAWSTDI